MEQVLVLGADTLTPVEAIGLALVALLAPLVAYLIRGEARRAELRTGSREVAFYFPVFFGAVVLLGVANAIVGRVGVIALGSLLLAALVAHGVRTRRRVERDPAPPPPPPVEELPEEYRFKAAGGSLAGWGIPMVILAISSVAFDGQLAAAITLGVAAVAAAAGLTIVFRRRRQQAIIADVERRAAELPREDLRRLVELLEVEHGRFEMRRLRCLVA